MNDEKDWESRFSHGVRCGVTLSDGRSGLLSVWGFGRIALDKGGRLTRIVDVPEWADPAPYRQALKEPWPVYAPDVVAAADADLGEPSIEIGGENFTALANHNASWQQSRSLKRFRATVHLARLPERPSQEYLRYLYAINRDIRFARVVYIEPWVNLEAVLPAADPRWLALSRKALVAIAKIFQPQIAWWTQPRELVDAFFIQAQALGPRI